MNAPLSRFLTRFADGDAPVPVSFEVMAAEPTVTLGVGELQSRIDDAREAALSEAEAGHAIALADLAVGRDLAVDQAVAEARALWCADEGVAHAEKLAAAFADLDATLSTRVAAALRPLVATALVERTVQAVREAIGHILADPEHPAVTVHGPADLIDVIREMRVETGKTERVAYVATDSVEITIEAAGSRIDTRLGASLAALKGL